MSHLLSFALNHMVAPRMSVDVSYFRRVYGNFTVTDNQAVTASDFGTFTVTAPTVVVACGSVESPALLLRSGIGGPAVGKNLRLHPAFAVMGIYDEPIDAIVNLAGEPINATRLVSFGLIWLSLAIYTADSVMRRPRTA